MLVRMADIALIVILSLSLFVTATTPTPAYVGSERSLPVTAGGYRLTQQMVTDTTVALEFVVGHTFTPQERQVISDLVVRGFHKEPGKTVDDYAKIRAALPKLRKL